MSVPSRYRGSATARKLWATMSYLVERDDQAQAGDRGVRKAAADRSRLVLEAPAEDLLADYFAAEREHVAGAIAAGRDPEAAITELEPDLRETLEAVLGAAARGRTGAVAKARKRPDTSERAIDKWVRETAARRVAGISETGRKRVARAVADAIEAGDSVKETARRIERLYVEGIGPARAETIARTEVGVATNWAQFYVAANGDVPMIKEWLTLNDGRERDDHALADGQVVEMGEPFRVGGDELMFPGDESRGAGPEQIVNCRCSVLYHVKRTRRKDAFSETATYTPSPAEFARSVAGVDSPDVAVALAFAKGVFGEGDDWVASRSLLMKHVHRIRRAEWSESEHPRAEDGRFGSVAGRRKPKATPEPSGDRAAAGDRPGALPTYSVEGQRRAEAARKWRDGAVLVYGGGSKVALNPGERLVVRGVWGMNDRTGAVYYNVETANGRKLTLVDTRLREAREGEPFAEPAPRPERASPKTPKAPPEPAPAPPGAPPAPAPAPAPRRGPSRPRRPQAPRGGPRPAAEYSGKYPAEIRETFERRWPGVTFDVGRTVGGPGAAALAAYADGAFERYPHMVKHVRAIRVVPKGKMVRTAGQGTWAYAQEFVGEIAVRDDLLNGALEHELRKSVEEGWHPPGVDTPVTAGFGHEFGHQVDFALRKNFETSPALPGTTIADAWRQFKQDNSDDIRRASGYATHSYRQNAVQPAAGPLAYRYYGADAKYLEGIAEAFAQMDAERAGTYSGPLSPAAKKIRKFLEDNKVGAWT